ncbi:uncharacterized protein B0H64DRAFT_89509 [Chaetomium fimeti]|jgi:hypothetical protein|uniref:Uncharacterized protein n=1 Tax=Chaetomium fimeti TaxID=1854472 RepID=A0AAE0HMB3_9PEZI|nr:hypothetical protein B0H64DRAFT_89509 [Chaetomium fimeti]
MSLARAFTTRRVKQSIQAAEERTNGRSNSVRGSVGTLRHKISSPVELIHTTNMLSYNAPDIHPMSASSTGSSQRSDDDMSDSALTNGTTPPTSPDVESPAKRSRSPEPNHLSCFFTVPPTQQQTPAPAPAPAARPEAPVVPQRAASHSKKQYNTLVRQRSASGLSQQSQRTVSTKASFTFSRSSSTSTSTSVSSTPMHHHQHKTKLSSTASPAPVPTPPSPPRQQLNPRPQRSNSNSSSRKDFSSESQQQHQHQHQHQQHHHHHHPFGNELAQVSELAEEYGVQEQLADAAEREEQAMLQKGLLKFTADEYMSDVRGLFASFMVPPRPVAAAWI